jgi:hypothetical protein
MLRAPLFRQYRQKFIHTMQTTIKFLRLAACLAASALSEALLAPGPIFAAEMAGAAARDPAAARAASASGWRRERAMPASSGDDTSEVPESGQTQLPYTPDTPRPYYGKPPTHVP